MKTATLIMALLLLPIAAAEYTEIMYNPPGADNNLEYIELVSVGNLDGVVVGDLGSNDTLTLLQEGTEVVLIVEEGFDYTGLECTIYSAGSSIGNNLNNGGDTIFLYLAAVLSTTYTDKFASDNGQSLHWDGGWVESNPSPCVVERDRTANETPINQTINETVPVNETPELNETVNETAVNQTEINETIGNRTNETAPVNETPSDEVNETALNETIPEYKTECAVSLAIQNEQSYYSSGESIKFRNIVEGTSEFSVNYVITTLFGDLVRNTTTENENVKTFTPSTSERIEVFILNSTMTSECGTASDQKVLIVVGEENEESETLNLSIISLDEEEYGEGDTIITTVRITRRNTRKSAIKLWAEQDGKKVSSTAAISVKNDGTTELPVAIKLHKNVEGIVRVKIEGLDIEDEQTVFVNTEPEITEPESKKAVPNKEVRPSVADFHTKHKKYSDEINLYATIEGEGEFIVKVKTLESASEEEIILDGKQTYKKAVPVNEGKNVFILELIKEGVVIASETLLLAVGEDIEEVDYFVQETVEAAVAATEVPIESPILAAASAPTIEAYEEPSGKKYVPYLLPAVCVIGVGLFVYQRKKEGTKSSRKPGDLSVEEGP